MTFPRSGKIFSLPWRSILAFTISVESMAAEGHASNGSWDHRPCVVNRGVDCGMATLKHHYQKEDLTHGYRKGAPERVRFSFIAFLNSASSFSDASTSSGFFVASSTLQLARSSSVARSIEPLAEGCTIIGPGVASPGDVVWRLIVLALLSP